MSYTKRDFPLHTLFLFDYTLRAYVELGPHIHCPVSGFDALMRVQKAIDSKDARMWQSLMYAFGHTYLIICLWWFEKFEDYETCACIVQAINDHNERLDDDLPTDNLCKEISDYNKGLNRL